MSDLIRAELARVIFPVGRVTSNEGLDYVERVVDDAYDFCFSVHRERLIMLHEVHDLQVKNTITHGRCTMIVYLGNFVTAALEGSQKPPNLTNMSMSMTMVQSDCSNQRITHNEVTKVRNAPIIGIC